MASPCMLASAWLHAAEFRLPSRWHPSPIGIPGAPAGILFCQEPVPLPEAGDHRLPQRQTAVVSRHHAVREHAKTPVPQEPVAGGQQKPVLEGATADQIGRASCRERV